VSKPKILVLDIETAPAQAYVWGLFDQNIGLNQIIKPSRVIMCGMKWVGEGKPVIYDERDDSHDMWYCIYKNMVAADAIVTYNGNRFDLPKLRGELILRDYDPLPPVTSIDLLRTVKKMGIQSNKLDFVGGWLGIGEKIKHEGFDLWKKWENWDPHAIKNMRRYCKNDVLLTEKLYKRLAPHITNHPYLLDTKVKVDHECPHCHQTNRFQRRGFQRTRTTRTPRYQCLECGGWSKGKQEKML
jgi:hypothetical protein